MSFLAAGKVPAMKKHHAVGGRVRPLVGLVVVGSLLVACGGDDDDDAGAPATEAPAEAPSDTDSDTDSDTVGDTAADSPQVTSAEPGGTDATAPSDGTTEISDDPLGGDGPLSTPADEYDPDGVIRFGYALSPSQGLDPHKTSLSQDTVWLAPIYDPLIIEMPDASLVPGLATEWEFVDDNMALELTLREGVTFQDGAAFNAEAVKINIERAKTVEGSAVAPLLAAVDSVEVVDEYTVKLLLNSPAATLPRILADRPGMMISPDAIEDPDLPEHPVGAGMYQVEEYRTGDRAILVPFPDYWNPEWVKLSRLEIVAQAEALTRFNGLRSGELDLALLDGQTFPEAEKAGLSAEQFFTTTNQHLQFNRTRAEFDNTLVRQAMNYAVDRQAIVDVAYNGYGHASAQFYSPDFELGYVDGMDDYYTYDPDKARELMAQAGLEDGFSFDLLVPSLTASQSIAQIVQAQFAEIGITTNFIPVDASQTASTFFNDKIGDMVVGTTPGRTDPSMLVQLYFTEEANSNPGGHTIPEISELYAESLVPRPAEERDPILKDMMAATVEQAGQIWISQPTTLLAGAEGVAGFHWSLRGQPDFRGTGIRAG
jgi:peptide/nickel transport system substrate-binding protein